MSNSVRPKHSNTAAKVPAISDLAIGELAVNTRDGRLFFRISDGTTDSVAEIGKTSSPKFTDYLQVQGTVPTIEWHHPGVEAYMAYVSTGVRFAVSNGSGVASTECLLIAASGCTSPNFTASSDERLKTNWRNISPTYIHDLAQVKYGIYERLDNGITQVGVTAQSMLNVQPETVYADELTGMLSVNYDGASLVAAIELAKLAETQALRIQNLEDKINVLIATVRNLMEK